MKERAYALMIDFCRLEQPGQLMSVERRCERGREQEEALKGRWPDI